jgi:hypothetical protein
MPIVWRTILVRPETKLAMLHRYLQAAMGWHDCHLYSFMIDEKTYGIPNQEWQTDEKVYDARRYTLAGLFSTLPVQFAYVYDFGDLWEHVVEITGAEPAEYRKQYPICVDGADPCPPEDSGGPAGYRQLLAALKDTRHPEHENWSTWVSSQWYPRRFSTHSATAALRDVQRGPHPGRRPVKDRSII